MNLAPVVGLCIVAVSDFDFSTSNVHVAEMSEFLFWVVSALPTGNSKLTSVHKRLIY